MSKFKFNLKVILRSPIFLFYLAFLFLSFLLFVIAAILDPLVNYINYAISLRDMEYYGVGMLTASFCVAAYFLVERADSAADTYAAHIFQEDTVNEINIEIDEADWQDMLENPLEEEYHKANITINGETIGNVAIRTKGNNSLTSVANSDSDRYSFKLDFDYYDDNGSYYGF